MQVTRQYHSTALLLPDGRVLSAGGGICGTCDSVGYLAKNAEVFSPPYLFKKDGSGELAPRPQITSAPDEVTYNAPFAISTPDAASISKVALVRLGAVTHSVNMEQRYVPLSFTAGSGAVNATAPANANVAPPGVYMLFVIDADGVPSVAKMVRVGSAARPRRSPAVPTARPTTRPRPSPSPPEPGSSFECKIDSGSYAACSSPKTTSHLADGSHTFSVRAKDPAGNVDPTPASRSSRSGPPRSASRARPSWSRRRAGPRTTWRSPVPLPRPCGSPISPAAPTRARASTRAPDAPEAATTPPTATPPGSPLIQVTSGDQTDKVVNSTAIKSSLNGGAADDVLTGGSANDTLTGASRGRRDQGDERKRSAARPRPRPPTRRSTATAGPGTADKARPRPAPQGLPTQGQRL